MARVRDVEFKHLESHMAAVFEDASETLVLLYAVIGSVIGIIVLTVVAVMRSINRPVQTLIKYAALVSQGELDTPPPSGMTHEMGELNAALRVMIDNLKKMLGRSEEDSRRAQEESQKALAAVEEAKQARAATERAKAEGMLAAAAHLEKVATVVAKAAHTLQDHVGRSEQGARQQAARVTETATAMEEMNSTVLEVARNAGQTSEASMATRDKADTGVQVVRRAGDSIQAVRGQSLKLKEDMARLDGHARDITHVMSVISDIADQTNLLALNAAIEGARAGEAGRGFAVVADEVRKLAEKTMASTTEVAQTITAIQSSTAESIAQMDLAVNTIEEATGLVNESGAALREIVAMADIAADQVTAIATAAEQQSATSDEINRSLADINTISGEVVETMRESSRTVNEVADQSTILMKLIEEMKNG